MTKHRKVLRVAQLLWRYGGSGKRLGTDTPIGSRELGVSAVMQSAARGSSQRHRLGKEKPRFPDHKYGRRTVKTQLYLLQLQLVHLAIDNYMFRSLSWPSSGCNPSCYKVTIQYTVFWYFAGRAASQHVYLNINQLDALNFMSLFQASTCFEHTCSSSGGQNCTIQSLVSSHL